MDEALLIASGPATLRLYGWSPPGLSIGYFQPAASFVDVAGGHVLVRRPTGGGAIYHGREITFALTLDTALLPEPLGDSYRLIHGAVSAALAEVGVSVQPWTAPAPAAPSGVSAEAGWCFATAAPADLVDSEHRKILGSAQRRIRRPRPRTLHHGSLVLQRPRATPFCAAVADQASPERVRPDLEDSMCREIAGGLGLRPRDGIPEELELSLARELLASRYGRPSFTNRR